ncbi:hypothetical protein BX616_007267 [Lobosporangium transversale]|uniref:4'-phosphopantetheinyl transferase superfamily n=1 Tax=Lobosporangium transversale TaxID=64571 RepID=A0A1Y2GDW4_9FUNG|nr:4'-phosphopantetheinyl transferase superfamily [Lobosporangium transversale]KAF9896531.1 hypothetical protein BX616_007267 [Lobosporangium transversale]ORZ08053.1 4'-phosphopantetheinyl transferase superfamily [Lobosporangium transversale]|eukprot:XP_021878287.1 4'-phosphopantetheinyl transferase superfamily [Lobosporangium transversale]
MTILGIGIDILHLPRIKHILIRHPERFLTRILTKTELQEYRVLLEKTSGKVDVDAPVRYLGARWALKEASYKAAFPHHKLTWQDVIITKKDGKPCLIIPEKDRFGIGKAHASVSHDGEYLIAQVLFEVP